MNDLLHNPIVVIKVLGIYWAFSAIVSSMPKPKESSYWGTWLYGALHLFAGSIGKFADSRISSLTTTVTETKVEPPKEKV